MKIPFARIYIPQKSTVRFVVFQHHGSDQMKCRVRKKIMLSDELSIWRFIPFLFSKDWLFNISESTIARKPLSLSTCDRLNAESDFLLSHKKKLPAQSPEQTHQFSLEKARCQLFAVQQPKIKSLHPKKGRQKWFFWNDGRYFRILWI